MRILSSLPLGVLLASILLCGCAGRPRPYERFLEPETAPDPDALRGRVVVLDAGHGGRYPGAIASDGTKEADVNLRVALELRRLLREAGATVILTREGDHDLLAGTEEATLRNDLMARVGLSNRAEPDLFLSLHHNSRPGKIGRFNRVETYHRMADDGPSRDAAARIHQHLAANLGLGDEPALLAGNYLVLRKSRAPAVLGEASYLTSRGMGRILSSPRAQALEARAYFAGILDYLSRGVPELRPRDYARGGGQDGTVVLAPGDPLPAIELVDIFGPGLDPQSVSVEWDGLPLAHSVDGDVIHPLAPTPLSAGEHRLALRARNLGGNAAPLLNLDVQVIAEPARLVLGLPFPIVRGGPPVPLEIAAQTASGHSVADGTVLLLEIEGGKITAGPAPFGGGVYRAWIEPLRGAELVSVTASSGPGRGKLEAAVFEPSEDEAPPLMVRARDGDRPLPGVWVRAGSRAVRTDLFGRALLDAPREGTGLSIERAGYRPMRLSCPVDRNELDLPMTALVPNLTGAEIVLDPAAGGDDPGSIGRAGAREADVNLAVARYLADYLKRAGAAVRLTRDEWSAASGVDRVRTESPGGARLFLTIRHGGPGVIVRHYPGSRNGKRAAGLIAEEASAFSGSPAALQDGADFTLLMTAAPALVVNLPGFAAAREGESGLLEPWFQRQEAWALFRGIVRYVESEECEGIASAPAESGDRVFRDGEGAPLANALVTLDDSLPLQTSPRGVHFRPEIPGRAGVWDPEPDPVELPR
ncbi:MAG: hypothetical protein CME06_06345 [Gemmatimonadetes bacterium]|nr:hypothetical protein [Gemmatimonadota bacterium]